MLKAVLFLLKLSLFVAAVVWLATAPGTVEINWHGYLIETSAGFVVAALLVLLAVYSVLYRIWRGVATTPAAWRRMRAAKMRERGYHNVTAGFVAIAAGDARAAEKHAARASVMVPGAPLAKLLSAQSHMLSGEAHKARRLFAELLEHEHAAFLGVRGLLQDTLQAKDYREALQHIRHADELQPKRGWVVKTLFDLETRNREWVRAEAALKKAEKLEVFTKEQAARHRQALLLARADEASAAGEIVKAHKLAYKAFDINPGFTPAVLRLVKFYHDVGKKKSALKVIQKAWAANPHPELGNWWMKSAPLAKAKSPYDKGREIYDWAKQLFDINPLHNASSRLMGWAALEGRLWREAREHLTRGSDYRGLAKLERAETSNEAKAREWLEILSDAPAPAKWVCTSCGHAAGDWTPLCRHCGGFNTAEWIVPEHAHVAVPHALSMENAPGGLFISPPGT